MYFFFSLPAQSVYARDLRGYGHEACSPRAELPADKRVRPKDTLPLIFLPSLFHELVQFINMAPPVNQLGQDCLSMPVIAAEMCTESELEKEACTVQERLWTGVIGYDSPVDSLIHVQCTVPCRYLVNLHNRLQTAVHWVGRRGGVQPGGGMAGKVSSGEVSRSQVQTEYI
jgi:hypothetical protein